MRKLLRGSCVIFFGLLLTIAQAPGQESANSDTSTGKAKTAGNVEVLSDTKGVDFGPYLTDMLQKVRTNWHNLIPDEARPPQLAAGVTSIEFAILPDGRVAGMKIVHPSGSLPMDRAAWGGITAGNPYPPLPKQFTGPFLALRFRFYYNPAKLPPEDQPAQKPTGPDTGKAPK